jgi:hypothetical protein
MVNSKADSLTPGASHPPGKAVYDDTSLHNVTGWDNTSQRALYPCLSAIVHRLMWAAG